MSTEITSLERYPFTPIATAVNTSSPSQSDRPVTLPHIPELHFPLEQALDALLPPILPPASAPAPTSPKPAGGAFMDALHSTTNRTKTWNNAPAFKSTLSPTLDAFASLSQATDKKDIERLLNKSWASNAAVTLRIIWNLRSIHEGKSAREQFYRAYAWLYIHHPRTALTNLRYLVESTIKRTIKRKAPAVVEDDEDDEEAVMVSIDPENSDDTDSPQEVEVMMPHGYWKDLLNILLLATLDQLQPASTLSALHVLMPKGQKGRKVKRYGDAARAFESRISEQAKVSRLEKHQAWHRTVSQKLSRDKKYRALYITVARLFADGLARDIKILHEIADMQTSAKRRIELAFDLTLVGKWAPSIGGSHDRVTCIATAIAQLLYGSGHLQLQVEPLSQPLTKETAHRLRSAYTRWITSPLRRFLKVPEVRMSSGRWDKIRYDRVPSQCMRLNKAHFLAHDFERFSEYMQAVGQGKASISGGTLLPHELLLDGIANSGNGQVGTVVDAQWNSLVERVREAGVLPNALAVCDVSASMGSLKEKHKKGTDIPPIAPAVALTLLLAQVARPPWAHTFITFHSAPSIVTLDPNAGLVGNAVQMASSKWGNNTDFNAVFTKLILPAAVEHKLSQEDMVQRVFVFSDMQFDKSRKSSGRWGSEHLRIKRAFERRGYVMPEIVYWNLAGDVAKPVTKDEEGVAFVSGFSPGMLKVFLEKGELAAEESWVAVQGKEGEDVATKVAKKRLDPIDTMLEALKKKSFAGLKVFD